MWNALNNAMNDHQTINTLIAYSAALAGCSALVAFYYALTYVPSVVTARLRRKR